MGRLLNESDVYALFDRRGMAQLHVGDIDVLPRVEAKPIVRARWISRPGTLGDWYCSNCGGVLLYEVLEVRSCEEVFPTSVFCERMILG